jgi:hypothetical protein
MSEWTIAAGEALARQHWWEVIAIPFIVVPLIVLVIVCAARSK